MDNCRHTIILVHTNFNFYLIYVLQVYGQLMGSDMRQQILCYLTFEDIGSRGSSCLK